MEFFADSETLGVIFITYTANKSGNFNLNKDKPLLLNKTTVQYVKVVNKLHVQKSLDLDV